MFSCNNKMISPSNKLLHNNISNHFILATLMVAPERSPETLGILPWRKPRNLKETPTDMGRK